MKQAAVILPYQGNRLLMQLRDNKPDIVHPGRWGLFSGTIETGENPLGCAQRELKEEINVEHAQMVFLSTDTVSHPDPITLHSFYCLLNVPVESITLYEGSDIGLFSIDQIRSRQLFSPRFATYFPVIDQPIIRHIVEKLFKTVLLKTEETER
jgi:8-oxo-dGTP diphosphatase